MHRRNLTEKGIQTFKVHFDSVLCGVYHSFPLNLWDRITPKTNMQLNLPQQANATPKVSAYMYLNGPHDLNLTPVAPLGCAFQIYKKKHRI